MLKKKKYKIKPLTATQKTMIKKSQWKKLGFSSKQIKELEDGIYKMYLSNEITRIRTESKDYLLIGIVIAALFGIIGSVLVTSLFKAMEPYVFDNAYLVYFVFSGVIFLFLILFISNKITKIL